jgi:hypothetical protein
MFPLQLDYHTHKFVGVGGELHIPKVMLWCEREVFHAKNGINEGV